MKNKIYITGIGTDVGKTVVAAIITKALEATYFKPIQCGIENGTDKDWVKKITHCNVEDELYVLQLPASPHLAAKAENVFIDKDIIATYIEKSNKSLITEGAGGLLVPINNHETFLDIIKTHPLPTIVVSRNYLGSINHSLLTAALLQQNGIHKVAWVFNDTFMDYEEDIIKRTGFTALGHIDLEENITTEWIVTQAEKIKPTLLQWLLTP
jgi:dethiobiotin synthetase